MILMFFTVSLCYLFVCWLVLVFNQQFSDHSGFKAMARDGKAVSFCKRRASTSASDQIAHNT